jgi:ABC-type lipoprotein release transport system permease subunit
MGAERALGIFLGVIPVVARRVAANARLLIAVVIGAVLAAALMAVTSIYTDAIRDLGLEHALREQGRDRTNLMIRSSSQVSSQEIFGQNRAFIEGSVERATTSLLQGQTVVGRSATFFPTPPGAAVAPDDTRPRAHLQFLTGLEEQIRVVEGRMPRSSRAAAPGGAPSIEVAMGVETARRNGIEVGTTLDLHPFWRPEAAPVRATVVGLIEPLDPRGAYWMGMTDIFDFPSSRWPTYPFFVTEETYFDAIVSYLPTMSSDFWHLAYLNIGQLNARNAEGVRLALDELDRQLRSNIQRTTMITDLPRVLRTFDEKLFFTRIPLLVLVLQIAGIVLYYLFMVSTMLVERQSSEIALLKSRGATTRQVMQIYMVEGLAIAFIAIMLGPPLAAGVISLLGLTPAFADLSGGGLLTVRLTAGAYVWALAGALLAYATLLWPAYQSTKKTMVQQRTASARPPKQPAFTRYYLDLVLVAIGALLFYQLNRRGGVVTERLFGEQSADPLLLMTPAFFILTVGIFFLRLFPIALRVLAWGVSKAQGTAVLIGMWQLVRNPTHYSRLVLLLMLATAVGMFAASFGSTVTKSYEDRAAYESGAGLRISNMRRVDAPGPNVLQQTLEQELKADLVSLAVRLDGSQGVTFDRTNFRILGVNPETFGEVAYFRDDFASTSLESMLATLAQDVEEPAGVVLPEDARWIGLWVNPTDLNGRVGIDVRVIDATGRYFTYTLGPDLGSELERGWSFLAADLNRPVSSPLGQYRDTPPEAPLQLQAISVRFFSTVSQTSGSVIFDDLQTSPNPGIFESLPPNPDPRITRIVHNPARTLTPFPQATMLADFNSLAAWEVLQGIAADPLPDQLTQVSTADGFALELTWRPVQGRPQTRGIRLRGESRPLAVYASEGFTRSSGLRAGDTTSLFINGVYVNAEIVGTFRLFPTLHDPRREPALIANMDRLLLSLNRNPRAVANYPEEAWMRPGPETASIIPGLMDSNRLSGTVSNFEELRAIQQRDPLIAAGWEGILFISFTAILMLSAIGFLIYSYLTAQKRTLEFAILRTMGFSQRQIAVVVGFEQVFVIGMGMIAGTLMGLRLGSLMIRYMGVTETGAEALPPMLLHVSWLTVGTAWLVLALVFLVTIGIVVLLYSRLALYRVLRIGEA